MQAVMRVLLPPPPLWAFSDDSVWPYYPIFTRILISPPYSYYLVCTCGSRRRRRETRAHGLCDADCVLVTATRPASEPAFLGVVPGISADPNIESRSLCHPPSFLGQRSPDWLDPPPRLGLTSLSAPRGQ